MSPSENKKAVQKMTVPLIQKMKRGGEKIVMVTCYDYSFARLIDEAGVDIVLVGDSLGMVIQGQKSTLPVTLEEMIYHSRCVAHGLTRPLLVTDMPFMSYQSSQGEAIKNAGRLLKEGKAESIKLEGGVEVADLIHRMNRIGIPVMGHIGLQPQSLHKYGGYKIQGKTPQEERHLLEDALAVQEAGCWSVVLEGVPVDVAQKITGRLKIPTVGIGCGPSCDGQVLVLYDLLGMNPDFNPRFLKRYANLAEVVMESVSLFRQEVKDQRFPTEEHGVRRNVIDATLKIRQRNASGT